METAKKKYHYQADLKQDLLEKGIQIICEKGVGALTLKALANSLGVTSAAMYHHYSDKKALMAAIVAKRLDELNKLLEEHAFEPFKDDIVSMFVKASMVIYDFCEEHPEFLIIANGDAVEDWSEYPALMDSLDRILSKPLIAITQAQGAGIIKSGDPKSFLMMAFSSIYGYLVLVFSRKKTLLSSSDPKSWRRNYFEVACSAINTIRVNQGSWRTEFQQVEQAIL
ncbi:TetR/AcrR family transcriptional regulator [Entomospira nematocerorum]|uniref:TetR/AcrR family transcriptional regulator n=2 Tax=Entomospira TaxID=2834378 RepID=A0A968KST2_9SPIO|nr:MULTISPECIES: TetR/AcrR family transcriptional regulator [Entomospira]NIZ40583.1 TetR/AcrR family transcriptional regulator [Entomospira entomophilus]NIZ46920.1 TetR/AcrR family transcriptional regulator [Entomospira nematocera]WDI33282.1 TetR/AcrR family transcriptional regulator [Entomospira nematocera]WDI34798.1 TetR/AcrR family transcriptional regulator [Entomospira entomophilus]